MWIRKAFFTTVAIIILSSGLTFCGSETPDYDDDDNGKNGRKDGGGDSDSDSDSDSDTDSDSDMDSDSDSDSDSDTDSDSDSDSDTDRDTDGDADYARDCTGPDDCPGGDCVRVPDEPGGYWTCVKEPPEPATEPSPNPASDTCTDSGDCSFKQDPEPPQPVDDCDCYLVQEWYAGFFEPHNECICTECETDNDCNYFKGEFMSCIPAGAWDLPKNRCFFGGCRVDSDCSSGGQCVPYLDPCSSLDPRPFAGKYCRYPGDCKSDADCGQKQCIPDYNDNDGFKCDWVACPG